MPWKSVADRLAGWLRPKSAIGTVYRHRLIELMEPLFYVFDLLWCIGVLAAILGGESPWWLLGVGAALAQAAGIRLVVGRPHVMVAENFIVVRGVFVTRTIPYVEIRRAEEKRGVVRIVLTSGEEPMVTPFSWRTGWSSTGDELVAVVMRHVKAARAVTSAKRSATAGDQ